MAKNMGGREAPALPPVGAVIVAAGSSSRMQGVDKQFVELEGVPVVVRAIQAFAALPFVQEIVVVCREDEIMRLWDMQRALSLRVTQIVAGGATRQASVFSGVRALSEGCGYVAIHDGARPFVDGATIRGCVACAVEHRAACAAVPVKDTIKVAGEDGAIADTPARDRLFTAQTPQVFERTLYTAAMENALALGLDFTDDCQLVERLGGKVYLSRGSYLNFKLTTPEDLLLAQAVAAGALPAADGEENVLPFSGPRPARRSLRFARPKRALSGPGGGY